MKTLHKKALSAAAVALLSGLACSSAFAADTPTDPEDAGSPIAANVTIVNDYRYRGITNQTLSQRSRVVLTTLMRAGSISATGTTLLAGLVMLPLMLDSVLQPQSKWTFMAALKKNL